MQTNPNNPVPLPNYKAYSKALDEIKIGKKKSQGIRGFQVFQGFLCGVNELTLKDYAEYKLSSGIGRFIEKLKLCLWEDKGWMTTKDFDKVIISSQIDTKKIVTQLDIARNIESQYNKKPLNDNEIKLQKTAATVKDFVQKKYPILYNQFISSKQLELQINKKESKINKLKQYFENKPIIEIINDPRFNYNDFILKYSGYQAYFSESGEFIAKNINISQTPLIEALIKYLAEKEPTTESEYKTMFPKGVNDDKLAEELNRDIKRYQHACILKWNDKRINWPKTTQNFKELIPEPIRKIFIKSDSKPTDQELSNLRRVAAFMTTPACTLLYKRVQQQSGDDVNPRSLTQEMNFFEKDGNCYLERKVLYHLFDTTNLIDNAPPIATLEASMIVNLSDPQAEIKFQINKPTILTDDDKNKIIKENNERNLARNKKLEAEALNVQREITQDTTQQTTAQDKSFAEKLRDKYITKYKEELKDHDTDTISDSEIYKHDYSEFGKKYPKNIRTQYQPEELKNLFIEYLADKEIKQLQSNLRSNLDSLALNSIINDNEYKDEFKIFFDVFTKNVEKFKNLQSNPDTQTIHKGEYDSLLQYFKQFSELPPASTIDVER